MSLLPTVSVKTGCDLTAVGAGFTSFFKVIPWPEIAGFLSVCYLLGRFAKWLWDLRRKP